jgi:pimeloyl-ACP methyl ester carboxylesterase
MQVSAADAEPIADAARYLDERGGGRPLGMAAISFAVGPAIIALDEPPEAGGVDFFLGIGGYYDLEALITYVTTGFYREDGEADWRYQPPKRYGKWVFVLTNAGRIDELDDRATLLEMASRKLDDPDADLSGLEPALGPDGEAVYALVTNADPDRVPALMAALPPAVRDEAVALDLRQRDLSRLRVDFVLIHDRNDRIIPAAQSEALARALPPGRARVHVVGGLDHAQMDALGPGDALSLVEAIYTLLHYRDEHPGGASS